MSFSGKNDAESLCHFVKIPFLDLKRAKLDQKSEIRHVRTCQDLFYYVNLSLFSERICLASPDKMMQNHYEIMQKALASVPTCANFEKQIIIVSFIAPSMRSSAELRLFFFKTFVLQMMLFVI